MLCPNCNSELMNVNGRNICVDCGTEVPDNQMTDNTTTFAVETPETQPVPANEAVTVETPTIDLQTSDSGQPSTENFFASEQSVAQNSEELANNLVESEQVEQVQEQVEDRTIDQLVDNEVENSQIKTNESPVLVDNFSVPVSETLPEEVEAPDSSAESVAAPELGTEEKYTPSTQVVDNISAAKEIPAEEPLASVDTLAPSEVPVMPETQVDESMAPIPVDINTAPQVNKAAPSMAPESLPQPEVQVPIDPFEIAETSNQNTSFDQNLVSDNYGAYSPEVPQTPESNVNFTDNRKILILMIAGVAILLLFIIGGVVAYNILTKPAVVTPIVNIEDSWTDYIGTDYQVKFPLTPEKSKETLSVSENKIELQKIFIRSEGATYAISSGTIPEGITPTPELQEFINALAKANNAKVDMTEVVNFDGEAATDYKLSNEEKTIKGKVIVRSNKVFYIQYISVDDTSGNYDTFIESFSFKAENIEG